MTADLGDSLPPDLAEVAQRELNETPAARTECLIQFRRRFTRTALCYETCSDFQVKTLECHLKGDIRMIYM